MRDRQAQFIDSDPLAQPSALHFRNRWAEPSATFFRGSRYFTVGHEWFVTLREGIDLGPFLERGQAELAVARHIAEHCLKSPGEVARLFGHRESDATEFELMVREMLGCLEQQQLRSENCAFVWTTQRIDELRRNPTASSQTDARITALEYLLDQLEG